MLRRVLFRSLTALLLAGLFLPGCDRSAEWERLKQQLQRHEQEIQALKLAVERMNRAIASLRSVLDELRSGGYVVSVAEESDGGTRTGYALSFSDGCLVRLSSAGEEAAPSVSIRPDADERWYWTLNEDWLLDGQGSRIPVSDEGTVPLLKAEDAGWSVSVDNGTTWSAAPASASPVSLRSVDTSHPDYVLLTLADGTVLQLPTWSAFVSLRNLVGWLNTNLTSLQTIVASLQDGDWLLSVSPFMDGGEQVGWMLSFARSGIIIIYSGEPGKDGVTPQFKIEDGWWHVSYDGGATWQRLDQAAGDGAFIDGIDFSDEGFVSLILSDGTTLPIPRFRPSDFVLDIPEAGFPIQAGETLAIPFSIAGSTPQQAVVTAVSDGHYLPQVERLSDTGGVIRVTAPSPYCDGYIVAMLDDGNGYSTMRVLKFCRRSIVLLADGAFFEVDEAGGTLTIPWTGNYAFLASTDASWIHIVRTRADLGGEIVISVDPNPGDAARAGVVRIHPEDNPSFTAQELYIREATSVVDVLEPSAMLLTVRPSWANDFTVCLPFRGGLRCSVDWGDGHRDEYGSDIGEAWVSHRYAVSEPTSFAVTVSGTVQSLNACDIPQQSGIVSVDHWGNLNAESVDCAFYQLTSLQSLAPDTDGFFTRVMSCSNMFYGCSGLKSLPGGLFRSGAHIADFSSTFSECSQLASLPSGLLEGCTGAESFAGMFERCRNLDSCPEDLLSDCPRGRDFSRMFSECGLTALPTGLFAACPDATVFFQTFYYCTSLTGVPAAFFDHNRKAINFSQGFFGCWSLQGESPYTLIDGKKVHLYERKDYPDYFVAPVYFDGCFNMPLDDENAIRAAFWW